MSRRMGCPPSSRYFNSRNKSSSVFQKNPARCYKNLTEDTRSYFIWTTRPAGQMINGKQISDKNLDDISFLVLSRWIIYKINDSRSTRPLVSGSR